MNGRSSLVTPNRARTRPSESSISISPARTTRFLICASQLGSTLDPFRSCPWFRSLGRRPRGGGEERGGGNPTPFGFHGAGCPLVSPTPPKREKPPQPEGHSGL